MLSIWSGHTTLPAIISVVFLVLKLPWVARQIRNNAAPENNKGRFCVGFG
jgi:hypothetical protein